MKAAAAVKLSGETLQAITLALKIKGLEQERIGALQDAYHCQENVRRIEELIDGCYASYWKLKEPKKEEE